MPERTGLATYRPSTRGRQAAWWLVGLGVSLVGSAAVGLGVGALTYAGREPSDGWADLAAVVLGMLAALLTALLLWLGVDILAVRRYVPADRRRGVWLGLALTWLGAGALAAVVVGARLEAVLGLTAVAVLVAMPPVLVARATR